MGNIIGHKQILDFFAKVIKSGSLSHAYCFVGPDQVGKKRVAEEISAQLLNITLDKLKVSPDYAVAEQLFDEKTEKTKKDITIDQMRDLRAKLSRHAYLGGYKIAVIDEAEKMNIEAANALLKTLEEPKSRTILFLLTKDESQLPETIQSRCQMIYFHPVDTDFLQKELSKRGGVKTDEAEEMARLSCGLPGKALQWLEDEDSYEWHKKEVERFESLFGQPFHNKLKKIEDLFGDKTDQIASRETLQKVLDIWHVLLRDSFYKKIGLERFAVHKIGNKNKWGERPIKIEESIVKAKEMLNRNIHPRLLVENILLNIP